jgi:prolyl oligopeptidase PreP (S9A serine peptidase family)
VAISVSRFAALAQPGSFNRILGGVSRAVGAALLSAAQVAAIGEAPQQPPATPKTTQVDSSEQLPDPFSYLRLPDSEDTRGSVFAKQADAEGRAFLEKLPGYEAYRREYHDILYKTTSRSGHQRAGSSLFYEESLPSDELSKLMVSTQGGLPHVLLDPNAPLWKDQHLELNFFNPSPDGKRVLLGMKRETEDFGALYVLDVASGKISDADTLERVDASSAYWQDNNTIAYSAFPAIGSKQKDGTVIALGTQAMYNTIRQHVLGKPLAEDVVLIDAIGIAKGDEAQIYLGSWVDPEGGPVFKFRSIAGDDIRLSVPRPGAPGQFDDLDFGPKTVVLPIGVLGDTLYVTALGTPIPHGKVVAIDLKDPQHARKDVIPEHPDQILSEAVMVNRKYLVVHRLDRGAAVLDVYSLSGKKLRSIETLPLGTVSGLVATPGQSEVVFSESNLAHRWLNATVNVDTGKVTTAPSNDYSRDPPPFETTRILYDLPDGKGKAAMYLAYAKGFKRDGTAPIIFMGYGGFNQQTNPEWTGANWPYLVRGAVIVVIDLPGDGTEGAALRNLAPMDNRLYVSRALMSGMDTAAKEGYCDPRRRAFVGASNGGATALMLATHAPAGFVQAVLAGSPVGNMMHYDLNSMFSDFWHTEYGDPANPAQRKMMLKWDPFQQVVQDMAAGIPYRLPHLFIQTPSKDPRVDSRANSLQPYALMRDYRARLGDKNAADLIFTAPADDDEKDAGHGSIHKKEIEREQTQQAAFLFHELGIPAELPK